MNVEEFVKSTPVPGRVIYAKLWGSHSHNTALPTSDQDFLMVFQATTESVLSLHPPPETLTNPEGLRPDYQAHEVRKFAHLLLKGNPGIIEALFTQKFYCTTVDWDRLALNCRDFLTANVVRQYLGYAQGQLHKLFAHGGDGGLHTKGGKYSEKWAYHLVRLLWDARRIAKGEEPAVWKEGEERDLLMKIRAGELSPTAVEKMAKDLVAEIDGMKPWKVPEQANEAFLDDWLIGLRRKGWASG